MRVVAAAGGGAPAPTFCGFGRADHEAPKASASTAMNLSRLVMGFQSVVQLLTLASHRMRPAASGILQPLPRDKELKLVRKARLLRRSHPVQMTSGESRLRKKPACRHESVE